MARRGIWNNTGIKIMQDFKSVIEYLLGYQMTDRSFEKRLENIVKNSLMNKHAKFRRHTENFSATYSLTNIQMIVHGDLIDGISLKLRT